MFPNSCSGLCRTRQAQHSDNVEFPYIHVFLFQGWLGLATAQMRRSEDNVWEGISSLLVSCGLHWMPVVRLGKLAGPKPGFLLHVQGKTPLILMIASRLN